MEQQLADKLAQQQADLDEQLAFVQVRRAVDDQARDTYVFVVHQFWQLWTCFTVPACLRGFADLHNGCNLQAELLLVQYMTACYHRYKIFCPAAAWCTAQAKLQKAQQQREYAKAFHADVLKKMAAEEVAQQVRRLDLAHWTFNLLTQKQSADRWLAMARAS